MTARRIYTVSYDIRDKKRLRLVHRTMRAFGDPLQYSVFRCELSPTEHARLIARLSDVINAKQDQVMLVNLGPVGGAVEDRIQFLGRHDAPPERAPVVL